MKEEGHAATGTLRKNRISDCPLTDPKQLEKRPRGYHEVVSDVENNIAVIRWNDNKCVTLASTHSGANPLQTAVRYDRKERRRKQVTMPRAIGLYNHAMGGVDRFDQNMAAYETHLRSKKWWWPMFRFSLDLCKKCPV